MRKLTLILLTGVLFLGLSCTKIDELSDRINDLESRLAKVEAGLTQLNTNTSNIQSAVTALEGKLNVTGVKEVTNGWEITFSDGKKAVLTNGKPGDKGDKGDTGDKGDKGDKGDQGQEPTIGITTVDGVLVWTVNDKVVTGPDGKPVSASSIAPEFKFEGGIWWYRVGDSAWKSCGQGGSSSECDVQITDNSVIVTINGTTLVFPKDFVVPNVEDIKIDLGPRKIIFVPVGKSTDLRELFTVSPEGAFKSDVEFAFQAGAFTIEDGILTATANSHKVAATNDAFIPVTLSARTNPDVKATLYVRTCATPENVEPESTSTVPEEERTYLFSNTRESFNALAGAGGACSWNPVNNSISGVMGAGGLANIYIRTQPVNPGVTIANGHLHIKYYVGTLNKLNPAAGQIELTSSNNPDNDELNWSTMVLANSKLGWNEVDLKFSDGSISGNFNPAAINWFRVYIPTTAEMEDAVQVKEVFVYAEKAPAVEAITVNLKPRKNIFVPIGEKVDLKEFFEVSPAGAEKTAVEYSFKEGAYTVDANGILTATGNTIAIDESNNVPVTISAKGNPDVKATINVRICAAPNNVEVASTSTVPEADRIYLFKEGLDDFNALVSLGGAGNYNAINKSIGGLMGAGGNANMYFTFNPVGGITVENGHLHFSYYISSLEKLNPDAGQVELCSGGADNQERNWPTSFVKDAKVGWNEIDLALKDSGVTGDPFNPEGIKWFRMYIPTTAEHEEAIQVKNVYIYAEKAPAIEGITVNLVPRKNIFVPIGQKVDLKEFFEVTPAGAEKTAVEYSFKEGAYTVDANGILTATGNTVAVDESNNVPVTISAKGNPDVKATINVRICAAPNNVEVASTSTVPEADRIYLFKEGLDAFNALVSLGGAGNYNAINKSLGGLMGAGGLANMYFTFNPVGGITVENGHLHFSYYISSLEKLNPDAGQVELCSGGADNQERNWPTSFVKDAKVGWNEIDLALKDSGVTGDPFNPEGIKWFRMYIPTTAEHEEAIQVKNVYIYAEKAPAKITIDGNLSDWDAIEGIEANSFKVFKYASDEANLYLYFKIKRSKIKGAKAESPEGSGKYPYNWRRYIAFGIDTDNNEATGSAVTYAGMNIPGCEAGANFYPFRGNAATADAADGELLIVNGVEEQGGISTTIGSSVPDGAADKVTAFGQVDNDFVYVEAQVARTAIGSPAAGQAKIQLSLAWDITDILPITLN